MKQEYATERIWANRVYGADWESVSRLLWEEG